MKQEACAVCGHKMENHTLEADDNCPAHVDFSLTIGSRFSVCLFEYLGNKIRLSSWAWIYQVADSEERAQTRMEFQGGEGRQCGTG